MRRKKPLARSRIRPRSPKRRTSEFARCYHSKAFVRWCKAQMCYACGMVPCDVAHVETAGMGRKADWNRTIPLCSGINGCHARQHRMGWLAGLGMTEESRNRGARLTEEAWLEYSARGSDAAP